MKKAANMHRVERTKFDEFLQRDFFEEPFLERVYMSRRRRKLAADRSKYPMTTSNHLVLVDY
jgi:hypothetical protein